MNRWSETEREPMKTNQSRRRRILSLMVLCAVTVALGIKPVAAQSIQPAQTTMDIPCTTTPFGRHLALGKEQELFASVDDMAAPQPHTLNWAVQDRNDAGQLHAIAFADVGVTPHHISALAATAADLDGDGKSEFVQGFTDSSGQSQLVVHRDGQSDLTHTETVSNQISRALAAGEGGVEQPVACPAAVRALHLIAAVVIEDVPEVAGGVAGLPDRIRRRHLEVLAEAQQGLLVGELLADGVGGLVQEGSGILGVHGGSRICGASAPRGGYLTLTVHATFSPRMSLQDFSLQTLKSVSPEML